MDVLKRHDSTTHCHLYYKWGKFFFNYEQHWGCAHAKMDVKSNSLVFEIFCLEISNTQSQVVVSTQFTCRLISMRIDTDNH